MAILRVNAIRELSDEDLEKKLRELKLELAKERGKIAVGATAENSGRISEIGRTVARIHTIQAERASKKAAKVEAAPSKTKSKKGGMN